MFIAAAARLRTFSVITSRNIHAIDSGLTLLSSIPEIVNLIIKIREGHPLESEKKLLQKFFINNPDVKSIYYIEPRNKNVLLVCTPKTCLTMPGENLRLDFNQNRYFCSLDGKIYIRQTVIGLLQNTVAEIIICYAPQTDRFTQRRFFTVPYLSPEKKIVFSDLHIGFRKKYLFIQSIIQTPQSPLFLAEGFSFARIGIIFGSFYLFFIAVISLARRQTSAGSIHSQLSPDILAGAAAHNGTVHTPSELSGIEETLQSVVNSVKFLSRNKERPPNHRNVLDPPCRNTAHEQKTDINSVQMEEGRKTALITDPDFSEEIIYDFEYEDCLICFNASEHEGNESTSPAPQEFTAGKTALAKDSGGSFIFFDESQKNNFDQIEFTEDTPVPVIAAAEHTKKSPQPVTSGSSHNYDFPKKAVKHLKGQ